jgi:hypothetical protein
MSDCAMTYCHVCGDFLFNGLHRGNVERWCRELSETISARPVETIFASPISETISVRRGRPRKGATSETITAARPWAAAGLSRATWYRRMKGSHV